MIQIDVAKFWRHELRHHIQARDWCEDQLSVSRSMREITVASIALSATDERMFKAIHHLGGLAADW